MLLPLLGIFFFFAPMAEGKGRYQVGGYPYDRLERKTKKCPKVQTVEYAGRWLPIQPAGTFSPFFLPILGDLERIVQEEADAVFGRAEVTILQIGSYACRQVIGSKRLRISEHAFGNAIDLSGFVIKTAKKKWIVSFRKDWYKGGDNALFLHRLVNRLIEEKVFRIILGPGAKGHRNVLHIDYGPSWYVRIRFPKNSNFSSRMGDSKSSKKRAIPLSSVKKRAFRKPPKKLRVGQKRKKSLDKTKKKSHRKKVSKKSRAKQKVKPKKLRSSKTKKKRSSKSKRNIKKKISKREVAG